MRRFESVICTAAAGVAAVLVLGAWVYGLVWICESLFSRVS